MRPREPMHVRRVTGGWVLAHTLQKTRETAETDVMYKLKRHRPQGSSSYTARILVFLRRTERWRQRQSVFERWTYTRDTRTFSFAERHAAQPVLLRLYFILLRGPH